MLDGLTPGFTLVLSACSCLLCIGLLWSFNTYFLPYIRRRRAKVELTLPQHARATSMVEQELRESLYDFPGLLCHCPRRSLATCELNSSKWSTTIVEHSLPLSPNRSTLHDFTLSTSAERRSHRLSVTSLSVLRQSLYSEPVLYLRSTKSCSTITTVGHAGNAVPSLTTKYRNSMRSIFSEESRRSSQVTGRRHSAPALSSLQRAALSATKQYDIAMEKYSSPAISQPSSTSYHIARTDGQWGGSTEVN